MLQDVSRVRAVVAGQALPERYRQKRVRSLQRLLPSASPAVRSTLSRIYSGDLPVSPDGQVCGLFAVDVAGFNSSNRDDDIQVYIHKSLYDMLEIAFDRAGVPWRECMYEDRGDGAFVVIPPTISAANLIHPIPDKLVSLVRRHNRVSCDAARIQLRVATHVGPVHHDGHGFIGHDVNFLHRMLEAPALKRMLIETSAEMAFVTSRYLYENIVVRRPSLIDPDVFKPLTVRVKETRTRAWAYPLAR
jgi:hypothetical protein